MESEEDSISSLKKLLATGEPTTESLQALWDKELEHLKNESHDRTGKLLNLILKEKPGDLKVSTSHLGTLILASKQNLGFLRCLALITNNEPKVLNDLLGELDAYSPDLVSRINVYVATYEALFRDKTCHCPGLWNWVQKGLAHSDHLTRKRAMFLLNQGLETCLVQGGDFGASNLFSSEEMDFQKAKMWPSYFLVLDTIEEPQIHIVKQIASRLQTIVGQASSDLTGTGNNGLMDISWLLVIYRILLNHQNQAIAKWGLGHILEDFRPDDINQLVNRNCFKSFILKDLMPMLNQPKLYDRNECKTLDQKLDKFIGNLVKKLTKESAPLFWNDCLLQPLTELSWDVVPFYFITQISSKYVPQEPILNKTTVGKLIYYVRHNMLCQSHLLKGAAQFYLLKLMVRASNPDEIVRDGFELLGILDAFRGPKPVLSQGNELWGMTQTWIKQSKINISCSPKTWFDRDPAVPMSCIEQLALGILLTEENIEETVKELISDVCDSVERPYAENITEKLVLLKSINIVAKISSTTKEALSRLIEDKMRRASFTDLDKTDALADLLGQIKHVSENEDLLVANMLQPIEICSSMEGVFGHYINSEILNRSIPLKELSSKNTQAISSSLCKLKVKDRMFPQILSTSEIKFEQTVEDKEAKKILGILVSRHISNQCEVLSKLMVHGNVAIAFNTRNRCIKDCTQAVQVGGRLAMVSVIKFVKGLVEMNDTEGHEPEQSPAAMMPSLIDFLNSAFSGIDDFRKNERYWAAMETLIDLCFDKSVLSFEGLEDTVTSIASKILAHAEVMPRLAMLLAQKVNQIEELPSYLVLIMAKLAVFGPLYRKDQKLLMDINDLASKDNPRLNIVHQNPYANDATCRLNAVSALRKFEKTIEVLKALDKVDEEVTNGKKRYFEKSLIHLVKHRVCVAENTIIARIMDPKEQNLCYLHIANKYTNLILNEDIQLSVRIYAEYLLITCCPGRNEMLEEAFETAKKERLSAVPSFLRIFTVKRPTSVSYETMPGQIMPWLMAQHFSLRKCAVDCFYTIFKSSRQVPAEYKILDEAIQESRKLCNQGPNKEVNWARTLYTLQQSRIYPPYRATNIFRSLAAICELPESEWQYYEYNTMQRLFLSKKELHTRVDYCGPSLPFGYPKAKTQEAVEDDPSKPDKEESEVIQKKITPWANVLSDLGLHGADQAAERVPDHPNLIMVASLIDRLPNLGGLCRSCEILGVGQYVIGSSKYVSEKEFTNVSVTAHKWIPIKEVKPSEVAEYLTKLREEEGYTVVAVEQTSSSQSLETFRFPEKTALLLGNEKEGIPVELIQLVDYCVEIPQSGLIRSFNVHVTGALVLWEYVRQKRLQNKMNIP